MGIRGKPQLQFKQDTNNLGRIHTTTSQAVQTGSHSVTSTQR